VWTSNPTRFLMEQIDITAARAVFLCKMHKIRESGRACIYYLDETWVNQNHTKKRCWKMCDSSGGLRFSVGKGGQYAMLVQQPEDLLQRTNSPCALDWKPQQITNLYEE
jgi:hypothetical protein